LDEEKRPVDFVVVATGSGLSAPGQRLMLPQGPNQRWSPDFLHDQLSDERRALGILDRL